MSGGFEKSAILAMLMPHLNVGAQKWTEQTKLVTIYALIQIENNNINT